MIELNVDDLIAIIGAKEVEIIAMRKQLASFQQRIAELEKPKEEKPA